MDLSDKVQNEKWTDVIMPKKLDLKEKIYFWTAQANACMLPFSLLYATFGNHHEAGLVASGINAALTYGSIFKLQNSYNKRNGKKAMTVDWRPSISFHDKRYS